jgi:hypothetical protein
VCDLRRFEAEPVRRLLKAALDPHPGLIEIDSPPTQPAYLTATHARPDREHSYRM